jgi:hypothetical protein
MVVALSITADKNQKMKGRNHPSIWIYSRRRASEKGNQTLHKY